jgi:hypothetical protein
LEEKLTQLDNWQEDRFIEMTTQLYQDFTTKEEAMEKLQEYIQKNKPSPSVSTLEANTMIE